MISATAHEPLHRDMPSSMSIIVGIKKPARLAGR